MKADISIKHNKDAYDQAVLDVCGEAEKERDLLFTVAVAENRLIGEILADAREVVEREAILINDALDTALSEKSEKLKSLKSLIEKVSGESAFMKSALNSIGMKTIEISALNIQLSEFVGLVEKVNELHANGALGRIGKAISAMDSEVSK